MDAVEITEDLARGLLEEHVHGTRWGRRGLAESLKFKRFEEVGASHVSFQRFVERRSEISRDGAKSSSPAKGSAVSNAARAPMPTNVSMALPSP